MILDNDSNSKKISQNDKEYINSLENRLKKQNQVIYYKRKSISEGNGSLKPKVVVYPRKKHQPKISKFESKNKAYKKDLNYTDEKLFEVEKTTDIPNFLEVKPKKLKIKEKEEKLLEWKSVDKKEIKKDKTPDKDIKEWKTIEEKEREPKKEITEWEEIKEEKPKEEISEWEPIEEEIVELETIEEEPKEEISEWEPIEEKIKPKEEKTIKREIKPKKEIQATAREP